MIFLNTGIAVLIVCAAYLLALARIYPAKNVSPRLFCDYAHRGLHNEVCPENSLAAFLNAAEQGFGIELDVQLSKDGEVFVFHDYSLARMTGIQKKLCELTVGELEKLRLLNTGEKIPRLSEVLSAIDGQVPLLIELKGESLDTSLCKPVAALLENYRGDYCLESFNPYLLGRMKRYLPKAFRGVLYTNLCREKKFTFKNMILSSMAANIIAKPNFIAYNHNDRNSLPVKIAGLYGVQKFSWTLKDKFEYSAARNKGEYAIFEGFLPPKAQIQTDTEV